MRRAHNIRRLSTSLDSRRATGGAVLVAALLVVVGCTSSGPSPVPSPSAAGAPRNPIAHRSFCPEEALAWRESYLQSRARETGVKDPPEVPLERWVTMAEGSQVLAGCLQEAGFPAIPLQGAGFGYKFDDPLPASQVKALDRATYVCYARFTIEPKYMQDWNRDQLGMLYDYNVEWLVPCLQRQGLQVSSPPSRDTFVSKLPPVWQPWYEVAMVVSTEKADELTKTCPELPPYEYFYG